MTIRHIPATAVALLLAISLTGCGGSDAKAADTGDAAPNTGPPPWSLPVDTEAAVRAAGLEMLSGEGNALHFHPHLDILVNGTAVPVPADIGIDEGRQKISALHTHDPTGVIHIESPVEATFTLGQLFAEWGVRLTSTCLGGLCADAGHALRVFVDGKPSTGDPAALTLAPHQEIELVYGPAGENVTPIASYSFGPGL